MLCTASVEEVIQDHYANQINQLKDDERELKKIIKFREDEIDHKDIVYNEGIKKNIVSNSICNQNRIQNCYKN